MKNIKNIAALAISAIFFCFIAQAQDAGKSELRKQSTPKTRLEPGLSAQDGEIKRGGLSGVPGVYSEIDTLPPEIKYIQSDCGDYHILLTENRFSIDPNDDPRQADRGIDELYLLEGTKNYVVDAAKPLADDPPQEYDFWLKVDDKFQSARAKFAASDEVGNTVFDSVFYEPDLLEISEANLDFGRVRLNRSLEKILRVKNVTDRKFSILSIKLVKGVFFSIEAGSINSPEPLESRQARMVEIAYNPTREISDETDFDADTLLIETQCLVYRIPLKGKGVIPKIRVSDWNAGDLEVNERLCSSDMTVQGLKIENPGTDTLIIYNIEGVRAPFSLSDPTIPPLPLRVLPRSIIYLREICVQSADSGAYEIFVKFNHNADPKNIGNDSVSLWKANVNYPGVYSSDLDFGRRRVKTFETKILRFRNGGAPRSKKIIYDFICDDNENFSIDKSALQFPIELWSEKTPDGSVLKEIELPVTFNPQSEGMQTVQIYPVLEAAEPIKRCDLKATAFGFGFLPRVEISGWKFEKPILINSQYIPNGRIIVKSTSSSADLKIKSIRINGAASATPQDFEFVSEPPEDFVLKSGDSLSLEVMFKAAGVGKRSAVFEVLCDAAPGPDENPIVAPIDSIIGYGIDKGVSVDEDGLNFGYVSLCDIGSFPLEIENTAAATTAEIDSVKVISGDIRAFSTDAPRPIILAPGEKRTIQVFFRPDDDREFLGILKIFQSGGNDYWIMLSGYGQKFPAKLFLQKINYLDYGISLPYPVYIESDELELVGIRSFTIEILYNAEWLSYDGEILTGDALDESWAALARETRLPDGKTMLTISGFGADGGNANPIRQSGSLAIPRFTLLYSDTTEYRPYFGAISFGEKTPCVDFSAENGLISFATCFQSHRAINVSQYKYSLGKVAPSPVVGDAVDFQFTVSFENRASVVIYNSFGQAVQTVFDKRVEAGVHTVEADVGKLASGVYIVRFESGIYAETRAFIIAR